MQFEKYVNFKALDVLSMDGTELAQLQKDVRKMAKQCSDSPYQYKDSEVRHV